jgi:hypothetical protein
MRKPSSRPRGRFSIQLCLFAAVACTAVATVEAGQVRPVNLEELTAHAATIFAGRCLEVEVIDDAGLGRETTVATFDVERAVKGATGSTVTLKTIGGDDGASAGVPRFRPGDEVVLFLYGESSLGLSSPVGLGQGRFTVFTDKQGTRLAVNDFGNRNLFLALSPSAQSSLGPALAQWKDRDHVAPDALLDMVEALTSARP